MDKTYYYKYFQFERQHWWFKARLEILESYLQANVLKTNKLKILNVGAATGATTEMLLKFGEIISVEYDKDCIAFTNEKLNLGIEWGDILDLEFKNETFDLVCAFDVIEHVEDHKQALSELLRVTKPNGAIVLTVPAHMHLWSDHDLVNHHFRRYVIEDIEKLINNCVGGEIEFISYFNSYLYFPISIFRKIKNLFKLKSTKNKELKSDFETFKPSFTNNFLQNIFLYESKSLRKKIPFSNGVSIICHINKMP
jgi:ubiquinone/menaquinone biosynthesis C-methylase UbiE